LKSAKEQTFFNEIVKTILKTTFILIIGAFFCTAVLTLVLPKTMANFYGDVGLNRAQAYCYKRVYNKSQKTEDLYNLIEVSIKAENFEDVIEFSKKMQNEPTFLIFCDKINERSTKNAENKYYVYVCDYDAYLKNQITNAYYKTKKFDAAKDFALNNLAENSNIYASEISTLCDLILSDKNLSKTQKTEKLSSIFNAEIDGKNVQTLMEEKIDSLPNPDGKANLTKLKIYHAKQKIYATMFYLNEAGGANEATLNDIEANIETNKNLYNQTLNAM